jgi:rhamnosyltransferase
MVEATIIMLVKNGARYLEESLQAIFRQQASFDFEVVAIDSGSRDATLEILGRYPVRVITIPPETFNHGETRNFGADQACESTRFLVYLTQDATPADPHWLAKLVAPMQEDERVVGVYSRHLPRPDSTPSMVRQMTTAWQSGGDDRIIKEMPSSLEEYEKNKFFYIFFSNTSSALRRSVWQQHRFPRTSFAEDAVWADTVLRAGYRLAYEPASAVIHSHDYDFTNQFRQNVDHAHGMVDLFDPPHYKQAGFAFREFRAIPRHVWRDYIFMKYSPYFVNISLGKRIRYFLFSPFWHLASSLGTVIGARLHTLPPFMRLLFSRQERIRQGK